MLRDFSREIIWLLAAAALCWFFPRTFLVVQAASLAITVALRLLERSMMRNWK